MEDEALERMLLRKSGGRYDLTYTTSADYVWHDVWLRRGELDKALQTLYATLAFATAADTGYCSERFCPQLPWLAPWQPNASGNGRLIQMIHRALVYEDEGWLVVLRGVPRSWLAPGERIEAGPIRIAAGNLRLNVSCEPAADEASRLVVRGRLVWAPRANIRGFRLHLRLPRSGGLITATAHDGDGNAIDIEIAGDDLVTLAAKAGWETAMEREYL
jgi:hypothetical protein